MRLDSKPPTNRNYNNSSSSSNSLGIGSNNSGGNRKPATSSLAQIGKHVPPPISPILNLKSTTSGSKSSNFSSSSSNSAIASSKNLTLGLKQVTGVDNLLLASKVSGSNSSFAWKLPSSTSSISTSTSTLSETSQSSFNGPVKALALVLPQRKVPAMTPEPIKKEIHREVIKIEAKNFFERVEEFPSLPSKNSNSQKEKEKEKIYEQKETNEAGTGPRLEDQAPVTEILKVKVLEKVGGDVNFLEDDGWLDGDNIDYSQNLFEDDDQFLSFMPTVNNLNDLKATSSLPISNINAPTISAIPIPAINYDEIKAKDLLAERLHSSYKKDIWKRTEEWDKTKTIPTTTTTTTTATTTTTTTTTTTASKIKILRRPNAQIEEKDTETGTQNFNGYGNVAISDSDPKCIKEYKNNLVSDAKATIKDINSSDATLISKNKNNESISIKKDRKDVDVVNSSKSGTNCVVDVFTDESRQKYSKKNITKPKTDAESKLVKKFSTLRVASDNNSKKNLEIEINSVPVENVSVIESIRSDSVSVSLCGVDKLNVPVLNAKDKDKYKDKAKIVYSSVSKQLQKTVIH